MLKIPKLESSVSLEEKSSDKLDSNLAKSRLSILRETLDLGESLITGKYKKKKIKKGIGGYKDSDFDLSDLYDLFPDLDKKKKNRKRKSRKPVRGRPRGKVGGVLTLLGLGAGGFGLYQLLNDSDNASNIPNIPNVPNLPNPKISDEKTNDLNKDTKITNNEDTTNKENISVPNNIDTKSNIINLENDNKVSQVANISSQNNQVEAKISNTQIPNLDKLSLSDVTINKTLDVEIIAPKNSSNNNSISNFKIDTKQIEDNVLDASLVTIAQELSNPKVFPINVFENSNIKVDKLKIQQSYYAPRTTDIERKLKNMGTSNDVPVIVVEKARIKVTNKDKELQSQVMKDLQDAKEGKSKDGWLTKVKESIQEGLKKLTNKLKIKTNSSGGSVSSGSISSSSSNTGNTNYNTSTSNSNSSNAPSDNIDPSKISKEVGDLKQYIKISNCTVDGLKPKFARRVAAAAKEFMEAKGRKLIVTSGYRSDQKQAYLYQNYVLHGGMLTARPSTDQDVTIGGRTYHVKGSGKGSLHLKGLAIDVTKNQGRDAWEFEPFARKFGIAHPFPVKDVVHYQSMDKAGDSSMDGLEDEGQASKEAEKNDTQDEKKNKEEDKQEKKAEQEQKKAEQNSDKAVNNLDKSEKKESIQPANTPKVNIDNKNNVQPIIAKSNPNSGNSDSKSNNSSNSGNSNTKSGKPYVSYKVDDKYKVNPNTPTSKVDDSNIPLTPEEVKGSVKLNVSANPEAEQKQEQKEEKQESEAVKAKRAEIEKNKAELAKIEQEAKNANVEIKEGAGLAKRQAHGQFAWTFGKNVGWMTKEEFAKYKTEDWYMSEELEDADKDEGTGITRKEADIRSAHWNKKQEIKKQEEELQALIESESKQSENKSSDEPVKVEVKDSPKDVIAEKKEEIKEKNESINVNPKEPTLEDKINAEKEKIKKAEKDYKEYQDKYDEFWKKDEKDRTKEEKEKYDISGHSDAFGKYYETTQKNSDIGKLYLEQTMGGKKGEDNHVDTSREDMLIKGNQDMIEAADAYLNAVKNVNIEEDGIGKSKVERKIRKTGLEDFEDEDTYIKGEDALTDLAMGNIEYKSVEIFDYDKENIPKSSKFQDFMSKKEWEAYQERVKANGGKEEGVDYGVSEEEINERMRKLSAKHVKENAEYNKKLAQYNKDFQAWMEKEHPEIANSKDWVNEVNQKIHDAQSIDYKDKDHKGNNMEAAMMSLRQEFATKQRAKEKEAEEANKKEQQQQQANMANLFNKQGQTEKSETSIEPKSQQKAAIDAWISEDDDEDEGLRQLKLTLAGRDSSKVRAGESEPIIDKPSVEIAKEVNTGGTGSKNNILVQNIMQKPKENKQPKDKVTPTGNINCAAVQNINNNPSVKVPS